MAAAGGDVSEWCDIKLLKDAFLRGCKTGAGAKGGDTATLSVVKKVIDDDAAYKNIQTGEFAKHSKANKMAMSTFITKEWFMKMTKGNESKAKALAKKIADKEGATQEKEAKGPKKGDDVTSRLTDTSKYTGAHKERFDASGQGKGKGGRVDEAKNTGYVGNYKGEGTFKGN